MTSRFRGRGFVAPSVHRCAPGLFALVALAAPCPWPARPVAAEPLARATAVERALERSPEAAADRAAAGEAARLVRAAGAYPHNPRLAVEAAGDGVGPIAADSRSVRVALTQELDVHGTRGARRAVAAAEAGVLAAEVQGHAHALGRRTEEAFGAWLIERRRAALADSVAGSSARVVAAARRAARQEALSGYALRQIELDEARARERTARARGGSEEAEATLRALLLAGPEEALDPVDDLDATTWRLPCDSLTRVALDGRHDIVAARARESLRTAETRLLARADRPGPELELFVERETERVEAEAFGGALAGVAGFAGFEDRGTTVGAGIAIPLPFHATTTWARGKGTIEESRARAARLRLEAAIPIEVRAACDRLATAQQRAAILGTALERAGADRARVEAAYREGRLDLDAYLAQRQRLVEAAEAELDALADVEAARSALSQATGLTHAALAAALAGVPHGGSR
jgi:outer membrane protein TolC